MPGGDGSVVIPIEMPVDDAEKELAKLKKSIDGLEKDLTKSQGKESDYANKYADAVAELEKQQDKLKEIDEQSRELTAQDIGRVKRLKEYNNELDAIKQKMSAMELRGIGKYSTGENGANYRQLSERRTFLEDRISTATAQSERYAPILMQVNKELDKQAEATEKARAKAEELKLQWEGQKSAVAAIANELDRQQTAAGGIIQKNNDARDAERARLQSIKDGALVSNQHILDLNNELSKLKDRMADLQAAGVGLGYEEYDQIEARISEINSEIEDYRKNLNVAGTETKSASGFMDQFAKRVKKLIAGAFVFQLISSALRKLREWLSKVIKTDDEASKAMAQLKAALLTLAQPIVEIIIPAFVKLLNILTAIIKKVASLVSSIFGKTLQQSADAAKNLYEETEALESVGSAAESAAGSLAGFDEINTISSDTGGGGGGGIQTGTTPPDFAGMINSGIDGILEIITGIALLAIGAIMAFSGANIPLGITLMVLGAAVTYKALKENWGALSGALREKILTALILVGMTALVIGTILAFSGVSIGIGIALMAFGIASIWAAKSLDWDALKELLQEKLRTAIEFTSEVLLAVGAILAFSSASIPLGIALMALGAAGLFMSTIVNWDSIKGKLQGTIGWIVSFLSEALIAVGAILLFTGGSIPLGLGMMVIGAIGLAGVIIANWDAIKGPLVTAIVGITAVVSAALLVLGIILLLSGAGLPLGLGLIAAGATGLAAVIAPNWDFIVDKVKEIWESVKNFWNTYIAKYFTFEYWKELALNIVDGVIDGLMSIFSFLGDWASSIWNTVTGWFGGGKSATASISASTNYSFDPGSMPSIPIASIPRLASGAVIPPNREFMAVLGDQTSGNNLEAPESLIRRIVREESGGGNAAILQDILDAIREGHVMVVDKQVLAKSAVRGINDMTRAAGKPVLLC